MTQKKDTAKEKEQDWKAIFVEVRIPAKSNSIPEGSRTPFRAEAEQDSGMIPNTNRSVATLAF